MVFTTMKANGIFRSAFSPRSIGRFFTTRILLMSPERKDWPLHTHVLRRYPNYYLLCDPHHSSHSVCFLCILPQIIDNYLCSMLQNTTVNRFCYTLITLSLTCWFFVWLLYSFIQPVSRPFIGDLLIIITEFSSLIAATRWDSTNDRGRG